MCIEPRRVSICDIGGNCTFGFIDEGLCCGSSVEEGAKWEYDAGSVLCFLLGYNEGGL